ncbi:phosphoenolpyruvate hydrolase family protein [Rhizobium sp. LjRoot30]|uniref:phosphoenolpyruvate hydrolase family protein n=1 Tax=Rhizobium sp. LjRoot30 TaxID=3342320 RepID=UPI003ECEA689
MNKSRAEILGKLNSQIARQRSILAVGAGNGLVARCAEAAGADLIMIYNSGYYRLNGLPSFVGNLPVGDANAIMLELSERAILPVVRTAPVIGGVYAIDPTRNIDSVLERMQRIGLSGVINFPTVGRLDGGFRRELEAAGYGFQREVDMVRAARERDMLAIAYVFNPDEAAAMAKAGADVVVGHVGRTAGGDVGFDQGSTLDDAVDALNAMFAAARANSSEAILLSHGGPIVTPEDAEYVNERTDAVGFVAASGVERIPVEKAIKAACKAFTSIRTARAEPTLESVRSKNTG